MDEGTPQGGPLIPILANIYLDGLDKLIEKRGYRFVLHANDITIFVQASRATGRVIEFNIRFLEGKQIKLRSTTKRVVSAPSLV